jgi:hypothetical protein
MAAELRLNSPPPKSGTKINVFPRLLTDGSGRLSLDLKNAAGTRLGYVLIDDGGKTLAKDITALHAVPPPVTPPPPAPGEKPVWDGSADNGFSPWSVQEWGGKVVIENSPVLPGHKAFKFNSQAAEYPNGPRAELLDTANKFQENDDWWFGDVLYIRSGQPPWQAGNHTVMQFKNDGTGSPPLNLDIRNFSNGGLTAQAETPTGTKYPVIVPMSQLYDRPIPIEIHVKFSSDPSIGYFEVWADGKVVIPALKMATLYPGLHSYLKQGQYGNQATTYTYWHGARRGASRASVLR